MRYEFATGDFVRTCRVVMLVHPEYSRIQISAGRDVRVLVFVNPSITLYYLHTKSQKKQERAWLPTTHSIHKAITSPQG